MRSNIETMTVPAFAVVVPQQARGRALSGIGEACAASAVATLMAVTAAVLAALAATRTGDVVALGLGCACSVAAPALAMIVHGLDARHAGRIVAGGALLAPAAAVYFLFEDPRWLVDDAVIAAVLAAVGALGALGAWRLEQRHGLWGWWLVAAPSLGGLWAIARFLVPAQVWLEWPW